VNAFWGDAWTSFKAVLGPVLVGAAFVLALLGPFYLPGAVVRIGMIWLAVLALLVLTFALAAANLVVAARRATRGGLPRTLHAFVPSVSRDGPGPSVILVVEPSALFGVNIFVTIYYIEHLDSGRDGVFERAIGIGRVANVQQNGLIQVVVLREVPSHAELWQRIRNHDRSILPQIVIKPSIDFNEAGVEVRFNE
jgi:hypothetical protein